MEVVPTPKGSEYPRPEILKRTKIRSCKKLARTVPACAVYRYEDLYEVLPLVLGTYEGNETRRKRFGLGSEMIDIAQYVVDCLQSELSGAADASD